MTDTIEQKALALLNEVTTEQGFTPYEAPNIRHTSFFKALCRTLEQHEAFRQEVSDAVENNLTAFAEGTDWTPEKRAAYEALAALVIAKPDPLVEALCEMDPDNMPNEADADNLRAAIEKRGGRIVFDGSGA